MSPTDLSVIVPLVNGGTEFDECLEALEGLREEVSLEVIVVNRLGEGYQRDLADRCPWVTVLPSDPEITIPEMRAVAVKAARGAAIAVIEDHVIVPPGWGRRMVDALESGAVVVGGSVENLATQTVVDWAAFLCEYSHCVPPLTSGRVSWLTGNNVAYRREVLQDYMPILEEGRWENFLHDRLLSDGYELICDPDIRVWHKKHFTFFDYLGQRFLYSRSFSGLRSTDWPFWRRLAFGAAAIVLPFLLLTRIVRRLWSRREYRQQLVVSVPLLAVFVCAWAVGDVAGCWFGVGDSLSKVR